MLAGMASSRLDHLRQAARQNVSQPRPVLRIVVKALASIENVVMKEAESGGLRGGMSCGPPDAYRENERQNIRFEIDRALGFRHTLARFSYGYGGPYQVAGVRPGRPRACAPKSRVLSLQTSAPLPGVHRHADPRGAGGKGQGVHDCGRSLRARRVPRSSSRPHRPHRRRAESTCSALYRRARVAIFPFLSGAPRRETRSACAGLSASKSRRPRRSYWRAGSHRGRPTMPEITG